MSLEVIYKVTDDRHATRIDVSAEGGNVCMDYEGMEIWLDRDGVDSLRQALTDVLGALS